MPFLCRWAIQKQLHIPASADFLDYSGMSYRGNTLGIISQVGVLCLLSQSPLVFRPALSMWLQRYALQRNLIHLHLSGTSSDLPNFLPHPRCNTVSASKAGLRPVLYCCADAVRAGQCPQAQPLSLLTAGICPASRAGRSHP